MSSVSAPCLRCGKAGYKTMEGAGFRFNNTPLQIVHVEVKLCQACRTTARGENRAAILRGGPAQ